MAYPTLALRLLISAPGDVPIEDMAVIRKTISRWNLNPGRAAGCRDPRPDHLEVPRRGRSH